MKKTMASPTGQCWCGCGKSTGRFFCPGDDGKAEKYLIGYLLRQLGYDSPQDPIAFHTTARGSDGIANLLASLGFDSTPQGSIQAAKEETDELIQRCLAYFQRQAEDGLAARASVAIENYLNSPARRYGKKRL